MGCVASQGGDETLAGVIAAAAAALSTEADPLARALGLGALIDRLQRHVEELARDRDGAITAVLTGPRPPSHRALARQLGISAQRVDQLARLARDGRREPG